MAATSIDRPYAAVVHRRRERNRGGDRAPARARPAQLDRARGAPPERLQALAESLGEQRASVLAVDLLDDEAPARIREHVLERHGRLDLLVNNAGAAWRARFADGGYANVRRTMDINFDAQVRLTEALLPLLRESAPSAIVNVSSTAARVARAGAGAYSASKFALAGWSDALWAEEREHGVHVGLVLPGFIATEGFPQSQLTDRPLTRWIVSTPDRAAEAIYEAGLGRRAERYVPRPYGIAAALRVVAPAWCAACWAVARRRR